MKIIKSAWAVCVLTAALSGCLEVVQEPLKPTAASTLAFVGANIIVGDGNTVFENGVLITKKDKISAVGASSSVQVPSDAQVFNVTGNTIIPGLINTHGHVNDVIGLEADSSFYTEAHVETQLARYARYGVTTVMSLGGGGEAGVRVRDRPLSDRDGSRLYLSGPVLTANSPSEAIKRVNEIASLGVDIIKIRVDDTLGASTKMAPEIYHAVIQESHRIGLRVAAHLYYLEDAKSLLRAGVDFLVHSVRDKSVDNEFVDLLVEKNVCYCPTLMREVSTFVYEERPAWFDDPFFFREVDPLVIAQLENPAYQERGRDRQTSQIYKQGLSRALANLNFLQAGGAHIAMGTDSGPVGRFQGYFEHAELELMVMAGLTPMQAIFAATGQAARCLQQEHKIGSLEPGKLADFVILEANPLDDILNSQTINSVWIGGQQIRLLAAH